MPEDEWKIVNKQGERSIDVVIFEGWCVGFRPLEDAEVESHWRDAVTYEEGLKTAGKPPHGRLGYNKLEDVTFVNDALRQYDEITDYLDAFIFLDAEDTKYVYDWRLEQEKKLREAKGRGMTDEKVRNFVDGYYPAYELWTDGLRKGIFAGSANGPGRQLRLVVGKDRKVLTEEVI